MELNMIRCKACGHVGEYVAPSCQACGKSFSLTPEEIDEKLLEIEHALEKKDFTLALEGYRFLADLGHTESEREYAIILERGELTDRNLDMAMTYFGRAAEKNDALSAYRYSRLVGRLGQDAARFWLTFSAILGCKEAYVPLAIRLSEEGDEVSASYFYYLAAACDDTGSIVTLAKRYYDGIGLPRSEAYAKWHLDKLSIPPIQAIRLAWRLRKVTAEDPPVPTMEDYDGFLRRLARRAESFGINTARLKLLSILSDRGDVYSRMTLGMLYAEGIGASRNTELAISLLSSAAVHGCAEAYRRLGDIYLAGRLVPADTDRALENYRAAAALGLANAYEIMGDVFCDGRLIPRDVPEAIRLFDLAAGEGDESARAKSAALKEKREGLYLSAMESESSNPTSAFRSLAISVGMGYVPAYRALARAYREGIGTKVDRKRGFLWLTKAYEAGDTDALLELALCYVHGVGINRDFKASVKYLRLAAKAGHAEANQILRRLLEAKKQRLINAAYSKAMGLIYKRLPEEAREALAICEALGHAKGIYTLGCLCEFGIGAPTDRERAFELYERAYSLRFRDPKAVYKLKVLKMSRSWG